MTTRENEILTLEECAALLNLSEAQLRKQMSRGEKAIPYSDLGQGHIRFLRHRVEEWLVSIEKR